MPLTDIKASAKAFVAGLASALSYAVPVVDDGLKPSEWLGIGLAFLLGLGATYTVPNKGYKPRGEAGESTVALVCLLVIAFAALVWLLRLFV